MILKKKEKKKKKKKKTWTTGAGLTPSIYMYIHIIYMYITIILKDLLAIGREPVHYENTPMQKYSDFFFT